MSSLVRRGKLIIFIGFGVVLVAAILWSAIGRRSPSIGIINNQKTDTVRQQYGDLYQAAWRQDEGRGDVLMTATLFVPTLVDLLGRDAARSEAENQLWQTVKDTTKQQVAIFLTIDSVGGPQTDQAIRDSLTLSADDQTFNLASWQPLIMPSRIVNISTQANSQSGVALFLATQAVDWASLTNLRLVSHNLGGLAARNFVWVQPGLLSALE